VFRQNSVAGAPGATFEFVSRGFSFEGGVVKNAPYSADAVTETTQRLADGNRISQKNSSALYRDSEGRTRREETLGAIGPFAPNSEPVQTIFINDPVSKTNLVLDSHGKTVRKMAAPEVRTLPLPPGGPTRVMGVAGNMASTTVSRRVYSTDAAVEAPLVISEDFSAGSPVSNESNMKNEPLGTQMIEGVRAEGTRTTSTIPAGSIGNDLPINIVSERWYSPELQTVIMTKHSDPRMGETVYRLTNVNRSEPNRSLFEAPADYSVVETPMRRAVTLTDQHKREILEPLRK